MEIHDYLPFPLHESGSTGKGEHTGMKYRDRSSFGLTVKNSRSRESSSLWWDRKWKWERRGYRQIH